MFGMAQRVEALDGGAGSNRNHCAKGFRRIALPPGISCQNIARCGPIRGFKTQTGTPEQSPGCA